MTTDAPQDTSSTTAIKPEGEIKAEENPEPAPPVNDKPAVSEEDDVPDEEENFLQNIENEEAKKEECASHVQPSDAAAAPRLLQDALKKGDVKAEDSEEEKKDEGKKEEDANAAASGGDEHVHQRVSNCISYECVRHTLRLFLITYDIHF